MKIINLGVGAWYPKGTRRLEGMLKEQGHTLNYKIIEGNSLTRYDGYQHKIDYIIQNLERYGSILWLDCSVIPLRPFDQFLEYLHSHPNSKKYECWAYKTGYTVGQSCNDRSLELTGYPKDGLGLPEYASTIFYLSNESVIADRFKHYATRGVHIGNREKQPGDSTRKEFLHHRQDQSILTLAINNTFPNFQEVAPKLGDMVHYNYKHTEPEAHHFFKIAGGGGNELA